MATGTSLNRTKHLLKPAEIFAISEEISKNYAPLVPAKPGGSTRRIALTSRDLLDISQEITRNFAPKLKPGTPKVTLLPVDPDHLFVAWNISPWKADPAQKKAGGNSPKLRIYPNRQEEPANKTKADWFEVDIGSNQTRRTVTVPEACKAESYTAAVGIRDQKGQFTVLAESKVTYNHPHNHAAYAPGDNGMSNGCQLPTSAAR